MGTALQPVNSSPGSGNCDGGGDARDSGGNTAGDGCGDTGGSGDNATAAADGSSAGERPGPEGMVVNVCASSMQAL